MDYKVYAVRVGDKYGEHYEKALPFVDVWIREEQPGVKLQWNKLQAFRGEKCPVVVIDIDIVFMHDYKKLFELPVERGEFLVTRNWWGQDNPCVMNYKISGGFYKFWPEDTEYIIDTFNERPDFWQNYYIENGTTVGPVNGEMNFVEDCVRGRVGDTPMNMKFVPDSWHTKWVYEPDKDYICKMNNLYDNNWLYLDQFHNDIKMVHYQRQPAQLSDKEI